MKPYWQQGPVTIYHGDSRDVLASIPQVDVVITDPPYELAFMGKTWDRTGVAFDPELWRWVKGCLPPGGRLLAAGGTRTFHRLAVAIEDAGFQLEDTLMWLHGQGFPKGKSKLKPAWEPFTLGRKPGPLAMLNIESCRIGAEPELAKNWQRTQSERQGIASQKLGAINLEAYTPSGRWPANVLLSHADGCEEGGIKQVRGSHPVAAKGKKPASYTVHSPVMGWTMEVNPYDYTGPDGLETVPAWACVDGCPVAELDRQSGVRTVGGANVKPRRVDTNLFGGGRGLAFNADTASHYGDTGTASRFFYVAKASKAERGEGNDHPTVKPLALMGYLVRLLSGQRVLDPFMGSGSTLLAAISEGRTAIGIDSDEHACAIAARRLEAALKEGNP